MKIDFGNINDSYFKPGSIFFLYGNFKRSFDVFCDFAIEKLKEKSQETNLIVNYVSVSECAKIINNQCDLFGTEINVFCIRNIEDNHLEKLNQLFQASDSNVFILESGDYRKSKSVTDNFTKNNSVYALPSFKNDLTLISLCKLFFPKNVSPKIYADVIKIINETDEGLISLFKKISLLLDSVDNEQLLQDYVTYKISFLQNMDFIPLARYFAKLSVKEKIFGKKQAFISNDFSQKQMIEKLLKAEINQKIGTPLTRSFLMYGPIL